MKKTSKPQLNRSRINRPANLPIKVIQYGEGNFIRAFVDYIIDKLNNEADFNAGVAVIQPRAGGIVRKLDAQDGLFHVFMKGISNGKEREEKKLISCIQQCIDPYKDYEAHLKLGEEEELQFIFSNTTEAGIAFDASDTFSGHPHKSFPAKVTALLYRRYEYYKGDPEKGLTIIPCELLPENAERLKEIVLQYAGLWDLEADFMNWINTSNHFLNTLVDRIVPGYPKDEITHYQNELEFEDTMLVSSEVFLLWVIEARKALNAKIPFDQIDENILLVEDLKPYRTRKVRILNGAHTVMVPFSILFGNQTVKQSVDHEFTGAFIKKAILEEINPTLPLPQEELELFSEEVLDRFRNPFIKHQLSSIALNSITKFKVRVLPSLVAYHTLKNELPLRLTFAFACLIRFYKGEWNGATLPLNDTEDYVSFMNEVWESKDYHEISNRVLSHEAFWDTDLTRIPKLTEYIAFALESLDEKGVQSGYTQYLKRFQ